MFCHRLILQCCCNWLIVCICWMIPYYQYMLEVGRELCPCVWWMMVGMLVVVVSGLVSPTSDTHTTYPWHLHIVSVTVTQPCRMQVHANVPSALSESHVALLVMTSASANQQVLSYEAPPWHCWCNSERVLEEKPGPARQVWILEIPNPLLLYFQDYIPRRWSSVLAGGVL